MTGWDQSLFNAIFGWSGKSLFLDSLAVFTARYLPYFLVIGAFFLLFGERESRRRIFDALESLLALLISGGIIGPILEFFWDTASPAEKLGVDPIVKIFENSFPSTTVAMLFALGAVIFTRAKKSGLLFMFLSLLVGFSQVYAGAHWPMDIIGGAGIGIISGMAVHLAVKRYYRELD